MKKTFLALLASGMLAGTQHAEAHGGGFGWGLALGALGGYAVSQAYYPRYYVQPAPSVVYVQPAPMPGYYAMPPAPPPNTRYFCRSSSMYYPDTKVCPEGWVAGS